MVHLALQAASTLAEEGVEVEVIDVGTLMPFDAQPCVDSVLRTGRLVVLHEAQWSGGLGHTIQSRIMNRPVPSKLHRWSLARWTRRCRSPP